MRLDPASDLRRSHPDCSSGSAQLRPERASTSAGNVISSGGVLKQERAIIVGIIAPDSITSHLG